MRRFSLATLVVLALTAAAAACGDTPTARPASPAVTAPLATTTASTPVTSPSAGTATTTSAEPVASTASIPTDELPRVVFARADGSTVALPVEVPPRSDYQVGLSGRHELDERGMVFYYPGGEGNAGFWMSHTHIDLSIAFVAVDGVISEIHEMTAESLEIVRPEARYEFAVEAPAGWYAEHDVVAGDTMRTEFDIADYVR